MSAVAAHQAESFIYFLRPVGAEGPVKIGVSVEPERRLSMYAAWSPYPLEIAALYPGDWRVENSFHSLFAAQHSHGEWFRGSPALTACIDAINAGSFDPATLPTSAGRVPRVVLSLIASDGWAKRRALAGESRA